jgi:hypothetical protein
MIRKLFPFGHEIQPWRSRFAKACVVLLATGSICFSALPTARADVVILQNGDRYHGKIVSVTTNSLAFQSEVLGTVNLPRDKVTRIILGSASAANRAQGTQPAATQANPSTDLAAQLRQLGAQTNLLEQMQLQLLGAAGPKASAKFNEMIDGLSSGTLNLADLRAEAKSAADQVRASQKDLGPDAAAELDGYLSILDSFLQETETAGAAGTNAILAPSKSKP